MMDLQEVIGLVPKYGIILLFTYALAGAGYRILLHPLSSYPGPLVAKVTDWYTTYFAARKRLHLITRRDHLAYGKVVRHGPDKLIFNSAQALHDIYDNDRVDKARTYLATVFSPYPNLFNVIDKDVHRTKRKHIGRVLSDSSMRKFEPVMTQQIDIFIRQIFKMCRTRPETTINMTERVEYLMNDIVGHLAFGYALNLQTDPANRHIIPGSKGGNHRINIYMQHRFLARFTLDTVAHIYQLMKRKSYLRTLLGVIEARKVLPKDAKYDLYSLVADVMDSSDGGEIWSEALFFFPAGADTTSTTVSALLFYLSRYPECYQRLVQEIRETFKEGSEIKGGQLLAGCQYLRACIDEALRISPPVPGTPWREQSLADTSSQPLVIDGHVVPKGTIMGVNIYSLHHNEEYFPQPFVFKPERWLHEETPEEQRKLMSYAFGSFLMGSRGCAGKAMAYLAASLIMAKLLWYFDLETTKVVSTTVGGRDDENEFQLYDIFTADHDGPHLILRGRPEAIPDLSIDAER